MYTELYEYKENETLLHLTYVVQKVGRKKIWGRILQVSENDILVYNVDNKSVEQIKLNQIDEIDASKVKQSS